ncbi:hypothetical protein [Pseudalkalibacillus berkeleyi]|uniref:DUF1461 domain-containing protein n=1 Tax=Pseudalkalibacillus berkeleyi TaxID=1069813 RepID=A0ABS9H5B4_9BACL|nr:hypothetical protein [Pseudalkalibacillus berkeleyi]MCF6139027.1 hypothetical protein [Pseudalkalibacillus berkeleyi]
MFRKIIRQIPAVILYTLIFSLLTTTFLLLAFKQTVLDPYSTIDKLDGTGAYSELQEILPVAIQETDELKEITSDDALNPTFEKVIREQMTINRVKEMMNYIETDIWDYILEKDTELEPLNISDIRLILLEEINQESSLNNRVIYVDKFVDELEWSSIMNVKSDSIDQLKTHYDRINSLLLICALSLLTLIGFSFLVLRNVRTTLSWLSGACIVSGISLAVTAVILHIIGIDWMNTGIDFPELFSPLSDYVETVMKQLYVDFLSAVLAGAGFITIFGIGSYGIAVRKPMQKYNQKIAA